jgi:hypothetical protein
MLNPAGLPVLPQLLLPNRIHIIGHSGDDYPVCSDNQTGILPILSIDDAPIFLWISIWYSLSERVSGLELHIQR